MGSTFFIKWECFMKIYSWRILFLRLIRLIQLLIALDFGSLILEKASILVMMHGCTKRRHFFTCYKEIELSGNNIWLQLFDCQICRYCWFKYGVAFMELNGILKFNKSKQRNELWRVEIYHVCFQLMCSSLSTLMFQWGVFFGGV